jgi:hypothetical protein
MVAAADVVAALPAVAMAAGTVVAAVVAVTAAAISAADPVHRTPASHV